MKSNEQKIIKTDLNGTEETTKLEEWNLKIKMPPYIRAIYSNDKRYSKILIEDKNIDAYFFDEKPKNYYQFNMESGEIVLTTLGSLEFCFEIMWEFPKGFFKLELGRKSDEDVAMITFKEISKEILERSLHFTQVQPFEKTLTPMIKGSGSQLNVIDKEIWSQNKDSIYSDDEKTFDNFLTKYEKQLPGQLILFEVKNYNSNTQANVKSITHEYTATAGFNSDGEISYLLIRRRGNK